MRPYGLTDDEWRIQQSAYAAIQEKEKSAGANNQNAINIKGMFGTVVLAVFFLSVVFILTLPIILIIWGLRRSFPYFSRYLAKFSDNTRTIIYVFPILTLIFCLLFFDEKQIGQEVLKYLMIAYKPYLHGLYYIVELVDNHYNAGVIDGFQKFLDGDIFSIIIPAFLLAILSALLTLIVVPIYLIFLLVKKSRW